MICCSPLELALSKSAISSGDAMRPDSNKCNFGASVFHGFQFFLSIQVVVSCTTFSSFVILDLELSA